MKSSPGQMFILLYVSQLNYDFKRQTNNNSKFHKSRFKTAVFNYCVNQNVQLQVLYSSKSIKSTIFRKLLHKKDDNILIERTMYLCVKILWDGTMYLCVKILWNWTMYLYVIFFDLTSFSHP